MNNKHMNSNLSDHSKINRIKKAMQIRAGNQKNNIYQIHYHKHIYIPKKRTRRHMKEMYIDDLL